MHIKVGGDNGLIKGFAGRLMTQGTRLIQINSIF